jgi:hypothetical protein
MQTFATTAPITGVLYVPAGRIRFTASGQPETTVQIAPADPAKGRDAKLAGQVSVTYSDGTLRVAAPAGNRILGATGAVEVTVTLPAGSSVQAKAASAQFTTTGRLTDVTYTSSQGTIAVEDANTATLVTVAAAPGTSAALDAGTTTGRINNALTNSGAPALNIHATTTVGDITATSR